MTDACLNEIIATWYKETDLKPAWKAFTEALKWQTAGEGAFADNFVRIHHNHNHTYQTALALRMFQLAQPSLDHVMCRNDLRWSGVLLWH